MHKTAVHRPLIDISVYFFLSYLKLSNDTFRLDDFKVGREGTKYRQTGSQLSNPIQCNPRMDPIHVQLWFACSGFSGDVFCFLFYYLLYRQWPQVTARIPPVLRPARQQQYSVLPWNNCARPPKRWIFSFQPTISNSFSVNVDAI